VRILSILIEGNTPDDFPVSKSVLAFAHPAPLADAPNLVASAETSALLSPSTSLCSLADIQRFKTQTHVEVLEHAA